MADRLSEEWSKLVHRMGREREDRIISGEMKLTVAAIFLIDDNWKTFKKHREIIRKPLRDEEIDEVEKMLRCKDPRYGFVTYICLGCGTQKIIGFCCNSRFALTVATGMPGSMQKDLLIGFWIFHTDSSLSPFLLDYGVWLKWSDRVDFVFAVFARFYPAKSDRKRRWET